MPFIKLQFRPGINRETTAYTNEGGWIDGDKIRFRAGLPETIGGWERYSQQAMLGVPRSLFPWAALDSSTYIGAGTQLKYYILEGGTPNDITPIRATTAAGDATFAATNGSTTLVVSDTSHGAAVNDFVTFSAAVSLGGVVTAAVLNVEHQITSIVDSNSYQIQIAVAANASDTGNGGAGTIAAYQLTVGLDSAILGSGWGAGAWSRGGWGSAADVSIPGAQLRVWSQDNFGGDLLICPRGGAIFLWDTSAGLAARAVNIAALVGSSEAPTVAQQVIVSERDRHTIAFGCDSQFSVGVADPLLVRFSSQETLLDWDVTSATNTAGEIRLGSGSKFLTAVQTKQQIVIFTDMSLHAMQFIGPPFTFGTQEVAAGISLIGPNAALAVGDAVYWMGLGDFHIYDGAVTPLPCDVKEYVFSNINRIQGAKICTGHNSGFSEIWWFYPSSNSLSNDRYVVYNYAQKLWYYGTMDRTAWADTGLVQYPLASTSDGEVYFQEFGLDDGSTNPPVALAPYIESSVVDMGEGDQFMFASRLIPDITFRSSPDSGPSATMTISARNFPGDAFSGADANPVVKTATLPVERFTDQLFIRIRGRSMSLRIESAQVGTAWRLGSPRLEVRTDGRR
jgi:hypothetical protein